MGWYAFIYLGNLVRHWADGVLRFRQKMAAFWKIDYFCRRKNMVTMCTYPILLDEDLVMQVESTLQINTSFQVWLQQQVEAWLLAQVNGTRRFHSRHVGLTDEMLAERLKGYPLLEESSFPALAAEDYGNYIKSQSGKLPKGLEQWL